MNLIYHESNYDLRGQILRHLNTANLSQIVNQYFTSRPIENDKYYLADNDHERKGKDSLNKKGLIPYNKNYYLQNNKKCCDFLNFHKKNSNLNYSKTTRDALEYRTILNYSHMKTILGHVQMDENLSISPVPIFCMCFSEDSEFIYTGDEIGRIKIWSTLTGGIIETFRLFSANEDKSAITDLLAFNNCLIACSEDKTVVIWNTKTLQICGSFSFDEGLLNVNGYKYVYEGITRHLLIVGAQSGKMYFIDMDINDSTNEEYKNIFPIKFHIDKTIQDNYNLGKTKSLELSGMSSDDFNGLLVSGFHDGLVCIWDTTRILNAAIQKREFLHNFTQYVFYAQLCHRTTVQLVEFSPDKTHFLTGSLDGTVLVWKIFPELIASIRKDYYLKKEINIYNRIPVSNITTICESENRIKCSVNVAAWTKKNNYIIAMISSKPRKKQKTDINEIDIEEDINSKKRTSSLLVYSLKLNKIIHKYNEHSGIKGLNFIDENYIFGCHPLYEEVIFTLNGTRNVILFNIKTGEIIKKFKQNDFFFESDKKTSLACEGVFSKKGDYFAITTYSGSLSIFSIYTKNSYSATYMNQFYSNEFDPNLQQINNNLAITGVPSFNTIFPKPVNMYNLPYIIEQPYSLFKLEQIRNNKKILNNNYCISDKEIKHRFLSNNLVTYEKNFSERVLECQKEEEAYYNAEKDNMNYRINRNNNNDDIEQLPDDNLSQDESYNENVESSNENNNVRNNRNNNSFIYDEDMDIEDDDDELELSRDDLRVTSALRSHNNYNNNLSNNTSNNLWSSRLRRPIASNNNHRINIQPRITSNRYNLRNNVRNNNNSSHSNSRNRHIAPIENNSSNNQYSNNTNSRNYNLRNRIEVTNTEIPNINMNSINNTNIINANIYTHRRKTNVINDDEDESRISYKKEKQKQKDNIGDNKEEYEYEEDDDIIIINKQKKDFKGDDKEDEKEEEKRKIRIKDKDIKEKYKHKSDSDDEEYKDSPIKKKKKLTKRGRGRPRKIKNNNFIDDDDEENYAESDYHDSESEDNKEAMKGLEAEELEDEEEEKEMNEDPDYIGINDDDEEDDNYKEDENYSLNSKNKNKKNKKDLIEESSDNKNYEYKKDPNFLKYKHHKILMEKITNDKKNHTCFFCHQTFLGDKHNNNVKLFGPFYLNENTGKILATQINTIHIGLKEIYIDINCLAENNDFIQMNKRDCIFNPTSSIEEVIRQNKICFRCGSTFATKKCHACQKMFHGNLCLIQMTEEYEDHKYCLECLKKKYLNYITDKIKPNKRINYDTVSKNYFLKTRIYNSQYYPQLDEEVYFILHAYILFLRDKFQYILYEIDEKQRLFWWMDNLYIDKNPHFNFYEPFICKIKRIEYCFPNEKTLVLIKEKSVVNQFHSNIKILIKLQLQIIELDNLEINIILFENDNPDFLVRKNIYEETLKYYQDNIVPKKVKNIQVNLGEDIINVNLLENKAEESNANFATSKFNSLKVVSDQEKDEQKYSFWDICINNNHNNNITKKMKFIMNGLLDTINSVCEKNKETKIFLDMVSEEGAPNYYEEIPVPMYIKLISDRLVNHYYITEESIKFDIQLLVDNATKYNGVNSGIAKDSEILKKRLIDEIDKLSNKYEENNNTIIINSNTNNNNTNNNSTNNINGNDSSKKYTGKKRKRVLNNLDIKEDMFNFEDFDPSEDYLYGNHKKRELRSSNNRMNNINNICGNKNNYNNISINISINNTNSNKNSSIKKKKKKKI